MPDPAAAPLGTDAEAAGAPPTTTERVQAAEPSFGAQRDGRPAPGPAIYIGLILAIAVAIVVIILLALA